MYDAKGKVYGVYDSRPHVFGEPYRSSQIMANKSGDKEVCVIRSYFTGGSRDATAKLCKKSAATVSNIWRELAEEIGPDGVATRELRVQLVKYNLTIAEAAEGAEAYKSVNKLGVVLDRLGSFAEDIYEKSTEEGFTGHSIADLLVRLASFEKSRKIPFDQVSTRVEVDAQRLEKIQEEIRQGESRVKQIGVGLDVLEEYVAVRSALKEGGLPLGNLKKTVNVLSNLEELDHDPKKIVEDLQAVTSLKRDLQDLQSSVKKLQSEKEKVESELGELNREVKEKRGALSDLAWMEREGFTPERIRNLRNLVVKISSARGMDSRSALDAFFRSLKVYDAKVGFDNELGKLKAEKTGVATNVADLRRELEKLEKKIGNRKEAVDALESLQKKGIKGRDILQWGKMLRKAGVSAYEFNGDVERYGSLVLSCKQKEKENGALETRRKILLSQIGDLKRQHSAIKASIRTLTNTGL